MEDIGDNDEVLDGGDGVDVNLGVDEGHAAQVAVLQLPDVDLNEKNGIKFNHLWFVFQFQSILGPIHNFIFMYLNLKFVK